jgi:hypothetical protein
MGKINWRGVILGGLLAGVVINVVEFVLHGVLLEEAWQAAMAALGKSSEGSGMWIFVAIGFLTGILAVGLYASIRPRFGPGPKTGACAGLWVWALAYLMPTLGNIPLDVYPNSLMFSATVVGLIEVPVATVVGAWPYKEA